MSPRSGRGVLGAILLFGGVIVAFVGAPPHGINGSSIAGVVLAVIGLVLVEKAAD